MRSTPRTFVALLLTATLAAPAVALAQGPAPSPRPMHGHMARSMPDRVDERIKDLRAQLHITPEQQAKWDQFAQVMRDNAQHMHQSASERAAKLGAMNASENMQSYAQLATMRAQDLQNLANAFQPLYESLSPDQQHTADGLFRDSGMRHGPRHHAVTKQSPS